MTIPEYKLLTLADQLHRRYGRKFHNEKEALHMIYSILAVNPDCEFDDLRSQVVYDRGNGKQHISGSGKREDQPILGFIKPPRSSRRRSARGLRSKPFDRLR